MATIVNTPPSGSNDSGSGLFNLAAVIILLLLVVLFFYYGLPALRGANSGPSVNVPEQVDVNVNTPNQGGGQ